MMPSRYENQIELDDVGVEGQIKISKANVIVFGAGGLGSSVIATLAGAGVGSLTIVDGDKVERKNLQRQFVHNSDSVGKNKASSAWFFVNDLNSQVYACYRQEFATIDNIEEIFHSFLADERDADYTPRTNIVIDAGDSGVLSYILSDICEKNGVFLISGSGLKYAGYSAVYCHKAPTYRKVFSTMLRTNTCSSHGVSGATVGVIGNIMAQTALNLIVGDYSDVGKLYKINLKPLSITTLDISSIENDDKDIPIQSIKDINENDVLINVDLEITNPILKQAGVRQLNLEELKSLPVTDEKVILLGNDESRLFQAYSILSSNRFQNVSICQTEKVHGKFQD